MVLIGDIYHIIPEDDIRVHIANVNCMCNPEIKDNLVIHNSFDGREFDEVEKEKRKDV